MCSVCFLKTHFWRHIVDFVRISKQSSVLWLHFNKLCYSCSECFACRWTFLLYVFVIHSICCISLNAISATGLTSEIATSSKVIRMLPELLRARVMTWPWLSDGWAGDTGTQTVLVCLKYSVSSFQALGSPLSQSPNTQNRPLKQDSILENLAPSTGSLD